MYAETVYQTLFWIGALGVAVMGAMGAAAHGSHHGADSHGLDGGHHGHGFADHNGAHHGHGHALSDHGSHAHHHAYGQSHGAGSGHGHEHGDAPAHGAGNAANMLATVMGFLSPLTVFSVSLGAGATGILLGGRFTGTMTAVLALLAGLALFALVVRPLTRFVRRFASQPAQALAGALASEAVSQNRFDADGRGIVNVVIDGQIVRLLAYLERDDHAKGVSVSPGEKLVVTQIDETKNTCRVTKL